jgi:hypothetical protein
MSVTSCPADTFGSVLVIAPLERAVSAAELPHSVFDVTSKAGNFLASSVNLTGSACALAAALEFYWKFGIGIKQSQNVLSQLRVKVLARAEAMYQWRS